MNASNSGPLARVAPISDRCVACGAKIATQSPGRTLEQPPACSARCSPHSKYAFRVVGKCLRRWEICTATLSINAAQVELRVWWPDNSRRCSRFHRSWTPHSDTPPLHAILSLIEWVNSSMNAYRWLATGERVTADLPEIRETRLVQWERDKELDKALQHFPGLILAPTDDPMIAKKQLDTLLADRKRSLDRGDPVTPSIDLDTLKTARNCIIENLRASQVKPIRIRVRGVADGFFFEADESTGCYEIWNPLS